MMAPDSKMATGSPPPVGALSTITGMRWLGFIFRNAGVNWSPRPMFTGTMLYGIPASSSRIVTFLPFGVGQ